MHQQNSDPDVRKAAPTTKSNATSHKQQNDCSSPDGAAQSKSRHYKLPKDWDTTPLGYKTEWLVRHARIEPPTLKLLMVNIASHVSSKPKTLGLAWPGNDLLAIECSVTVTHVKRLIKAAVALGMLEAVSVGGGAASTHYRVLIDTIGAEYRMTGATMPSELPSKLVGATRYIHVPGTSMYPVHPCTPTGYTHVPPPGTPMYPEPYHPDESQGGEGSVPAGSGAGRPTLSPEPQLAICPEWVDKAALQRVGARNPKRNLEVLITKAIEYNHAGVSTAAINAELVSMAMSINDYKVDLRMTVPKPPKAKKQTGKNQKAPGESAITNPHPTAVRPTAPPTPEELSDLALWKTRKDDIDVLLATAKDKYMLHAATCPTCKGNEWRGDELHRPPVMHDTDGGIGFYVEERVMELCAAGAAITVGDVRPPRIALGCMRLGNSVPEDIGAEVLERIALAYV